MGKISETITDKTGLSVGVFFTLIAGFGAGVGSYAQTRAELTNLREKFAEQKAFHDAALLVITEKQETTSEKLMEALLRTQRGEDNYARLIEMFGEVKSDVRMILTRSAGFPDTRPPNKGSRR